MQSAEQNHRVKGLGLLKTANSSNHKKLASGNYSLSPFHCNLRKQNQSQINRLP